MHQDLFRLELSPWIGLLFAALGALAAGGAYAALAAAQGKKGRLTLAVAFLWAAGGFAVLWRASMIPTSGQIVVSTYWVLDTIAFLALVGLTGWRARKLGLDARPLLTALPFFMLASVVLSRTYAVARGPLFHGTPWPAFTEALHEIVSGYGGINTFMSLATTLGVLVLHLGLRRLPRLRYLDLVASQAPVAFAIAKLSCFCGGCCFGVLAKGSSLGVRFPPGSGAFQYEVEQHIIGAEADASLARLPVQLYEVAALVALYLLLAAWTRRERRPGSAFGVFLVGYAAVQAWVETMRADPARGGRLFPGDAAWNLTFPHWLSAVCFLAGVAVLAAVVLRGRRMEMEA